MPQPRPEPVEGQHELAALDTLMQSQPDSALHALLDFNSTHKNLVPFDRHYADLLISEALFKCDYEQTLRTEVQSSLLYFDSLAAAHPVNDDYTLLSARAHYMNGVGFMESDSVVEACTEYIKALEIMEEHFEEKELVGQKAKFMALTYSRLGEIFYSTNNAQIATEAHGSALSLFAQNEDSINVLYSLKEIANDYCLQKLNDSALHYYEIASKMATELHNDFIYNIVLSESATLYYEKGLKEKAFSNIKKAISKTPLEDTARLKTRLFSLGLLFMEEKEYDSAIFCFTQTLKQSNYNIMTSSQQMLATCYFALGDTATANLYLLQNNKNLMEFVDRAPITTLVADMYNSHMKKKNANIAKAKISQVMHSLSFVIFVIIIAVLAFTFVTIFIVKRLKTAKYEADLANVQLQKERDEWHRKNDAVLFKEEPIYLYIMNVVNEQKFISKIDCQVYKDYALNNIQLSDLQEAIDKHFDSFTKRLKKRYPDLNKSDLNYCYLFLLGLSNADCSALMQRSYQTVCERKRKLEAIFDSKNNLFDTLNSFAYEDIS